MQNQDLEYSVANGEMREAREENEKLKSLLTRLVKDYQCLQTHFFDILQQDGNKQEDQAATSKPTAETSDHGLERNEDDTELVSLRLGLKTSDNSSNDDSEKKNNSNSSEGNNDANLEEGGLALGLGITSVDSSVLAEAVNVIASTESNSFEEETPREVEEPAEIRLRSKVLKTMRSNGDNNGETASQQSPMKKARVSVRARCDTQMMNDGCQWRKYGQKIAKGNPCPRAYYRCTMLPSCPVRKQVQRCAEDMSILITTYEGTHNHPLPISATAMASTTSAAAASVLQSPSLTSKPLLRNLETFPIFNYSNLNALNFSNYQIPKPPHYFPNSSISTCNSHPTITLDFTSPSLPNTSNIGRFASGFSSLPRYSSSTSLNFSLSSTFSPSQSSIHSPYWISSSSSSTDSGYFNNNGTLRHNKIQNGAMLNTGKQLLPENLHQPNFMSYHATSQQALPESIAAATQAIRANPKFQSALAAALTTFVGNGTVRGSGSNGIGSASKSMNVPSSSSVIDQEGSLALFSAPLPSTASKSASSSPDDESNQLIG